MNKQSVLNRINAFLNGMADGVAAEIVKDTGLVYVAGQGAMDADQYAAYLAGENNSSK